MILKRSPTADAVPPPDVQDEDEGLGIRTLDSGLVDGVDYVFEGSEADLAGADEPEITRGKTREQLAAELAERQRSLDALQAGSATQTAALTEALKGAFSGIQPQTPAQPAVEGYRIQRQQAQGRMPGETEDAYQQRLEREFVAAPVRGVDGRIQQYLEPALAMMVENVQRLGRKVALGDAQNKAVYDRFGAEVEQFVASQPAITKAQDPDLYERAIKAVRANHQDVFMAEAVQAALPQAVDAYLKSIGVDPEALKKGQGAPGQAPAGAKPAAQTPASPTGSRPPGQKGPPVKVPAWFITEQSKRGLQGSQIALAWTERNRR